MLWLITSFCETILPPMGHDLRGWPMRTRDHQRHNPACTVAMNSQAVPILRFLKAGMSLDHSTRFFSNVVEPQIKRGQRLRIVGHLANLSRAECMVTGQFCAAVHPSCGPVRTRCVSNITMACGISCNARGTSLAAKGPDMKRQTKSAQLPYRPCVGVMLVNARRARVVGRVGTRESGTHGRCQQVGRRKGDTPKSPPGASWRKKTASPSSAPQWWHRPRVAAV